MNLKLHFSFSTASAIIATFGSIILAQFVSPTIYGEVATVLAICSVISALSSARLETALFSAPDEDLLEILFAGICNSLLVSLFIYFVLTLIPVITFLSFSKSYELIPLLAFVTSSNQCLRAFDARASYSKHIEPIKLFSVIVNYLSIVLIGRFLYLSIASLVLAAVFSQLCAFSLYIFSNRKKLIGMFCVGFLVQYITILKKYKSHIAHDVPSAALNIVAQQSQIISVSLFVSPESAGFYSLAKKPFTAISQFFIPPLTNHVRNIFLDSHHMPKDFFKQSKTLFLISAALSTAASIASFVLLKIINPMYEPALIFVIPFLIFTFFKNWVSPLTSYLYIIGKVKANLVGQFIFFIASIIPIPILIIFQNSIGLYAYLSAVFMSFVYVYYYRLVRFYARGSA